MLIFPQQLSFTVGALLGLGRRKKIPRCEGASWMGFVGEESFEDQFQVFKMFGAVSRAQRMVGWSMCVYVCARACSSLKGKNKIKPSLGLWILFARWLYLYDIRLVWTSGKDLTHQQFSGSDSLLKSPLKQPRPGCLPPSLYLLAESKSNTVQGYTLGWEPGNLDGLRSASHCRCGLRNKLLNWHTCLWVFVAALLTRAK